MNEWNEGKGGWMDGWMKNMDQWKGKVGWMDGWMVGLKAKKDG